MQVLNRIFSLNLLYFMFHLPSDEVGSEYGIDHKQSNPLFVRFLIEKSVAKPCLFKFLILLEKSQKNNFLLTNLAIEIPE
jgi:hypothetical protein